jgi:hypothetical protein
MIERVSLIGEGTDVAQQFSGRPALDIPSLLENRLMLFHMRLVNQPSEAVKLREHPKALSTKPYVERYWRARVMNLGMVTTGGIGEIRMGNPQPSSKYCTFY